MARVVHFEISAVNPQRAIDFYKNAFGWTIEKWNGLPDNYWLCMTGPKEKSGIDGAIMMKEDDKGTRNTIDVENCDEFMEKVAKAGGKVLTPKMGIPGVGWMAYCEDTEGNIFGIMQEDVNAK